jgi:hypothetical protein
MIDQLSLRTGRAGGANRPRLGFKMGRMAPLVMMGTMALPCHA